jgi:hypothetical protein
MNQSLRNLTPCCQRCLQFSKFFGSKTSAIVKMKRRIARGVVHRSKEPQPCPSHIRSGCSSVPLLSSNHVLFHASVTVSSRLNSAAIRHSIVRAVSTSRPVIGHLSIKLLSCLRLRATSTGGNNRAATTLASTTTLATCLPSLVNCSSLRCSSSWLRLSLLGRLLNAIT